MRDWTFWEWVAYGALFVAALVIAADTGFRTAPDVMEHLPEFFHSQLWGFTPVVLVLLATMILSIRAFATRTSDDLARSSAVGGMEAVHHSPGVIDIRYRSGTPYETSDIVGGRVKSVVSIGIKNSGGVAISNCKVFVEKISPPPLHIRQGQIYLSNLGFTLHPFDPEKLIEVAVYWDHIGKYRFVEPQIGGYWAEALTLVDVDVRRAIVVTIEATECRRSALFHIWLDESQTLRLQFVGDAI